MTTLEVWGSPIAHSRSPQLHAAAYGALGLDWTFSRREVTEAAFDEELAHSRVRGLSVTFPLKERAFRAAAWRDERAELTGVANTLFFGAPDGPRGYNTDVAGIVTALGEIGAADVRTARIVGSGATTTSAVVALAERGATRVELAARRPERAADAVALAERLGMTARAIPLADVADDVELTIATVPGGTVLPEPVASALSAHGGVLFDVAYSPWPSALAEAWTGEAHHGLGMLLHQAVAQVRVFTNGDPRAELENEPDVVAAMRAALMAD